MLIAAPILLGPLAVLVLMENEAAPSQVELAIAALPSVGDAGDGAAPFGTGNRVANNVALPLYANSAAAAAASLDRKDTNARPEPQDYASLEYAALHPLRMAANDFMVGQFETIYTSPVSMDLSMQLLQGYCDARPGDAFYGMRIERLPIDPALLAGMLRYEGSMSGATLSCAQL